jgi:tetratricopeptide (TPR) repeat protein/glycosyltransferase involved in cell wall biosynthesis
VAEFNLGLGAALVRLGSASDEAEACLRRAVELNPFLAEAFYFLGVAASGRGQWSEAVEFYGRGLEVNPSGVECGLGLAEALGKLGRWSEAVERYGQMVLASGESGEVCFGLGQALGQLGRWEEAVVEYRRAVALGFAGAEVRHHLGYALGQLGRWEEAVVEYRLVVEVNPKSAPVRHQLGYGLMRLGRWGEAAVELRKAVELYPGSAVVWQQLGDVLRELGEDEEAVGVYRKAIATNPNFYLAHHNLGEVLEHLGRWVEAVTAYDYAVNLNPEATRSDFKLTRVLGKLEGVDELQKAGNLEVKLKSEAVRAFFKRSQLQRKYGKGKIIVAWVHNDRDLMTHKYRVHNYSEVLEEFGVHSIKLFDKDLVEFDLAYVDVLILCRIDANEEQINSIKKFKNSGKTVIFDIDDLVFNPDLVLHIRHIAKRDDAGRKRMILMAERLKKTLNCCDYATVSTLGLKKEIERFGIPAFIVPNNINKSDIDRASPLVEKNRNRKTLHTRIGYFSGTATHEYDFQECADALFSLIKEREDIQLMVVGELEAASKFKEFGNRFIQINAVSHYKMFEYLATVDINIAPLEFTNIFTQGKSELKIFESALLKIPTIISPTASYTSIIIDGHNGFIARNSEEWRELILRLVDNKSLRLEVGEEAHRTIAARFSINHTLHEALAVIMGAQNNTLRKLSVRSLPPVTQEKPAISIIAILYKKRNEVVYFLESLRRQTFDRKYEVILVNDCSPDDSVHVVRQFIKDRMSLMDTNQNMLIKIISNKQNSGNCTSRNNGISESGGEVIIVVDADCLFNDQFLSAHYEAHQRGLCDVAIGPKGIETNGRPPMSVLGVHNANWAQAIIEANPQDGVNQDSFVNCVTRNFSVKRDYINKHFNDLLFDEAFNYNAHPDSGFGWEDVEMGCRLYSLGARIKFLDKTASLHISHIPTVDNPDRPYRSLKNFRRLHEKHPNLKFESRQWSYQTYDVIINWCRKVGRNLDENLDYKFLRKHLGKKPDFSSNIKQTKKLKILTYRWHCSHQYELYRIGHEFTLATDIGNALVNDWEWSKRPLPLNAKLINIDKINVSDYDLAILHFDENVLHPKSSVGLRKGVRRQMVPDDWGKAFKKALKWDIPKIAICHGTPQFYGQYDIEYNLSNLGVPIEKNRLELVDLLSKITVVCNSYQAQQEWQFKKSVVIWQGFSPHDFPPNMKGHGVLSMEADALTNRPHYNGYLVLQEVRRELGSDVFISAMSVPDPPVTYISRTNEWAKAKYENYVRELGSYSLYINPTVRSPMPRTRGEAMMAGLVTVSLRNHDVDKFIDNGLDGFYADSPDEMAEQIRYLVDRPDEQQKMGLKSRLKAMNVFNQDRYLAQWESLLKDVVG